METNYQLEISYDWNLGIDNIMKAGLLDKARYYFVQKNEKWEAVSHLKIKTDNEIVIEEIIEYLNDIQLDCKVQLQSAPKYWILRRDSTNKHWWTFMDTIRRASGNSFTSAWAWYGYNGANQWHWYIWWDRLITKESLPVITVDEWYHNRFIH